MDYNTAVINGRRPVLVGDIGGTNSRLSIWRMNHNIRGDKEEIKTEILDSHSFTDIIQLLKQFLKQFEGTENYPLVGVLGMPGPVFNNQIHIIANLKWPRVCGVECAKLLNMKEFQFLNDFEANG